MIAVEIEDDAWRVALPEVEALVGDAARAALAPVGNDIAILLTSDMEVAALNARFRGKPGPTNVLSFPAAASAAPHLGDLALAYGVCAREAAEQGKSLADHLSHLVVHGVLHLLGLDHLDDAEAEEMEAREREVLKGLGIADPDASASALAQQPHA